MAVSQRAITQADLVLSKDRYIGLTRDQLIQAFDFIENMKGKKGVYSRKQTNLPCSTEHCPKMGGYLIRDINKKKQVGHGTHKRIQKAIFYGSETKLVADCNCDKTAKGEIKILHQLKGKKGIVPFLGSQSMGKNRHSIYLEYFPEGSLRKLLKHDTKFTEDQIMQIALDITCAVQTMHKEHLIHRDLHEGNVLLKIIPKNMFEAVLVDFGKTLPSSKAKEALPQTPASKNPPENLVCSLSKVDRYLGEVYALGCLFYHIIWKEPQPWSYVFNSRRLDEMSGSKKKDLHEKIISLYKKTKNERVGHLVAKQQNQQILTPFERFQLTTFDMLNYNPQKRPSIKHLVEQFRFLRSHTNITYSKKDLIKYLSAITQ
jgi:serine/threonine protein kinase